MTAVPVGPAAGWEKPPAASQPGRVIRVMLPAAGQAAGMARRQTRGALAAWELGHLEETAVLLVSELVGNAVRHARGSGSGLKLRLAVTRGYLRVEVADADPRPPRPRCPGGLAESGFGLVLVEALAADWGVDHDATGKKVWIELDARPAGQPKTGSAETRHAPPATARRSFVQRTVTMAAQAMPRRNGPASRRGGDRRNR